MKVYQQIASKIQAIANCEKSNNVEWFNRHTGDLSRLEKEYFPHGSGFDSIVGTIIEKSSRDKLYIFFNWHCMNDGGYYDGWLNLDLIVTPAFHGFDLKIKWYTKSNDNDKNKVQKYKPLIEEFLYDEWQHTLSQEIMD